MSFGANGVSVFQGYRMGQNTLLGAKKGVGC
jgi:hypothetical protein